MCRSVKVLLAVAALGAAGIGLAGAQVSDQCALYPQSPGCPQYRPGQGYERNPQIGPTYRHEAPRYQGEYQYAPSYRGSSRGGVTQRDIDYYCSLGSQTPRSMRKYCR